MEPGDLLAVDILDVGMLEDSLWGFTGIFAKENGGSFLVDHYPEARKTCWDYHGIKTTSRHIPGVEFAGIRHPGLIGTLPSKELLEEWNKREKELFDTNPDRVPALCTLPYADTAHMDEWVPPKQRKQRRKRLVQYLLENTEEIVTSRIFHEVPRFISQFM